MLPSEYCDAEEHPDLIISNTTCLYHCTVVHRYLVIFFSKDV